MRTMKIVSFLLAVLLAVCALAGCSQAKKEAVRVMQDYTDHIIRGEYAQAYELLSDFDKGNISRESFVKWREQTARFIEIRSSAIDSKIDTFKDYKYLGTDFGTVYGLKVNRVQTALIPGVEMSSYDKDTYRIMVQMQKDGAKVLLLLTNLYETIAAQEAYLNKLP